MYSKTKTTQMLQKQFPYLNKKQRKSPKEKKYHLFPSENISTECLMNKVLF